MGIVITIVLIILAIGVMAGAISRAKEQTKGHNRCAFCRTHLRRSADKMKFADVCRKCGKTQPWAAKV